MTTKTILGQCLGCEAPLAYTIETFAGSAPELLPPLGAVAFAGGHLCTTCGDIARAALKARRMTFQYGRSRESDDYANECSVGSVTDAVDVWHAFITRTGYGVSQAGNGGIVRDASGKTIARISYNGRVWAPDSDTEIQSCG